MLKIITLKEETFAVSRFLTLSAKVYVRKMFEYWSAAKVYVREFFKYWSSAKVYVPAILKIFPIFLIVDRMLKFSKIEWLEILDFFSEKTEN